MASAKFETRLVEEFQAKGFSERESISFSKIIIEWHWEGEVEAFLQNDLDRVYIERDRREFLEGIGYFDDIPESKHNHIDCRLVCAEHIMDGEYNLFESEGYIIIVY